MQHEPDHTFLIKKYGIELKVSLQHGSIVKVEPHHCKDDNRRLCLNIARTQSTLAQARINSSKEAEPYSLLMTVFDTMGWDVKNITEQ